MKNSLEKFFLQKKVLMTLVRKKIPEKVFVGGCPGNNLSVGVGVGDSVGVGGLST